jgi:hypothetical protein
MEVEIMGLVWRLRIPHYYCGEFGHADF